jgi:hypothetical protein
MKIEDLQVTDAGMASAAIRRADWTEAPGL